MRVRLVYTTATEVDSPSTEVERDSRVNGPGRSTKQGVFVSLHHLSQDPPIPSNQRVTISYLVVKLVTS